MAKQRRLMMPVTVGCVVYLRSGSPRMTVIDVKDITDDTTGEVRSMVDVVFSTYGTNDVHRETFPELALDVVTAPPFVQSEEKAE